MYKQNGVLIGFRHAAPGSKFVPEKRKAVTEAFVKVFDGNEWKLVATGKSECSLKDQFNRKLGRVISLGRALGKVNLPEETKKELIKLVQ